LYQYNGKELIQDAGLGWHSYGKRYYDAAIGRFPNVDPLIDTFHFVTGYNYAENEPVGHIDLWGLQKVKPDQRLSLGDQNFLTALGSTMETVGDAIGKAESAALVYLAATTTTAPPLAVVTIPTAMVVDVAGQMGGLLEFGGQSIQHLVKEDKGKATSADRAKLVGNGVIEFLPLGEPIEQTLKGLGTKDQVAKTIGNSINQGIQWAWDKLTSDE
jgi:RHS repeat-associated protein